MEYSRYVYQIHLVESIFQVLLILDDLFIKCDIEFHVNVLQSVFCLRVINICFIYLSNVLDTCELKTVTYS